MTLALWIRHYSLAVPIIAGATLLVFAFGWWCSWMGRERYVDKRIADAVAREHNELRIRCEVAEAKARAYGIGLRAAGATMCDMAELSKHEVKVVMVKGAKND